MERWETVEDVAAALTWFEAAAPGWQRPAAHGLVADGEVAVWNVGAHYLPPAVLGAVLQHDGSTAAIEVAPDQLAEAIDLLSPAEACAAYDHPNLLAWRDSVGKRTVAVFIR